MYRFDSARDAGSGETRNDPRSRPQSDGEVVVERKSIVADRQRDDRGWPELPDERRRGERRRIERMGTDI